MIAERAKKIYETVGAEKLIITSPDLRFYLTGFQSSDGCVVTDESGTVFYTDSRYIEAAEAALEGSGITVSQAPAKSDFSCFAKGSSSVGAVLSRITANEYISLISAAEKVIDCTGTFAKAMGVKESGELELIERACNIADAAYTHMLGLFKEGMSENDAAAELEYLMRKHGASGTSFETIVAFGSNSSVPHHETGKRKLRYGDIILMDFGCKFGGYCSDCTRTILFGDDNKHEEFKKSYSIVLQAQKAVKEELKTGMTGRQADAIARDFLCSHGLDKYFTHSLGHGIGVNIHEYPGLSPASDDILADGMVFSDEPGIYVRGEYGIRIEDTVTLFEGRVKSLTKTDTKLFIL